MTPFSEVILKLEIAGGVPSLCDLTSFNYELSNWGHDELDDEPSKNLNT